MNQYCSMLFSGRRGVMTALVITGALAISAVWFGRPRTRAGESIYQGPLLRLESPVIDLGAVSIDNTSVLSCRFDISNRGLDDLKIVRIESGCSCTVPQISSDTIRPGEKAQLFVKVTKLGLGARDAMIRIHSNDPVNPTTLAKVSWNSVTTFGLSQFLLDFGDLDEGTSAIQSTTISTFDELANPQCLLANWTSTNPLVRVRAQTGIPILVGRELKVGIEVTAGAVAGKHIAQVNFQFDKCLDSTKQLTVRWNVRPDLELVPKGLLLQEDTVGNLVGRVMLVARQPIKSEDVQWSFKPQRIKPSIALESVSPTRILVSVKLPADFKSEGSDENLKLTMRTTPETTAELPIAIRNRANR